MDLLDSVTGIRKAGVLPRVLRRICFVYWKNIITLLAALVFFVGTGVSPSIALAADDSFQQMTDLTFKSFSAEVVGDVCNLRDGPSTETRVVGSVTWGTVLTLEDFRDNWAKINYGGRDAWIAGWLVDIDLKSPGIRARITCTDVNMRDGPDLSYDVILLTQKDSVFPAEAKRGEWIKVRLPSGDAAWVFENLLALEVPDGKLPEKQEPQDSSTIQVVATDVNFRSGPGTNHSIVGSLSKGDVLMQLATEGGWTKAISAKGVTGWVATYLTNGTQEVPDGGTGPSGDTKPSSELAGKTIVVDPGHGGRDPGVISSSGIMEKDVTLPIALKVKSSLELLGAKVIMTRTGDYTPGQNQAPYLGDLDSRIHIANSNNADAFVSIHINSYPADSQVSGIIGFYCPGSVQSQNLATYVSGNVARATGMLLRGNRSDNFRVLLKTKMPATLLELGFMTNRGDVSLVTQSSFQDLAAQAVAKGVATYFGK